MTVLILEPEQPCCRRLTLNIPVEETSAPYFQCALHSRIEVTTRIAGELAMTS